VNHRTIAVLRAAALVPLVSLALLGVALAVAGGELTTLLVRVGFLIVAAGVVTGALRWSVLPSVSPPLVAGIVALWVLALSGAAEIGGSIVLVATAAVVALVALRHVRPTEAADVVRPSGFPAPRPVRRGAGGGTVDRRAVPGVGRHGRRDRSCHAPGPRGPSAPGA